MSWRGKSLVVLLPLAPLALIACAGQSTENENESENESVAQTDDPLVRVFPDGGIHRFNLCGNASTTPVITAQSIAFPPPMPSDTPPPNGYNPALARLERMPAGDTTPIEYVSGTILQLDIDTDGCTGVQSVTVGSQPISWTTWDRSSDSTHHALSVGITQPNITDGSTDQVTVTIVRAAGSGTATYTFPIVHVRSVLQSNGPNVVNAQTSITGSQFYNLFADSLWETFNGTKNEIQICDSHFCPDLYDYDPAGLSVYVDNTGVWLSFSFKLGLDIGGCNPTIKIESTFNLLTQTGSGQQGLVLNWLNPVQPFVDWGWCEPFVGNDPVAAVANDLVQYFVTPTLQAKLQNGIQGSLPAPSLTNAFLNGTVSRDNEVIVNARLTQQHLPAIEFDMAYDPFTSARSVTTFSPNDQVSLFASGIGMTDVAANVPGAAVFGGPEGIGHDTTPYPSRNVARTGDLPDPSSGVGRVLALYGIDRGFFKLPAYSEYSPGCTVSGPVTFGVNDTVTDAARVGSPYGYHVHAVFVTDQPAVASGVEACTSFQPFGRR
jgi:hypothetical protein